MMTAEELEEYNKKRKFLLDLEQKLADGQEAAVLKEAWEEAARFGNRLHTVGRVRQRLEANAYNSFLS